MTSINDTFVYDEVIVPHLQRMTHLESLTLYLSIEDEEKFIDGLNLTTNILSHMTHLNQLLFNIRSIVSLDNQVHLPSTERIQRSFTNCTNYEVICYVDFFPNSKTGQCCVYTYPYTMLNYDGITNSFPAGLFKYVRCAQLFGERPFEHTFFLRIAQAFPSLERLGIENFGEIYVSHHFFITDSMSSSLLRSPDGRKIQGVRKDVRNEKYMVFGIKRVQEFAIKTDNYLTVIEH